MQIKIVGGTLTKDEQFELGRLLLKAGYTVSRRTEKGRGSKSSVIINYDQQEVDGIVEDLS
ncbi:hypothetical protein [Lacrimispora sp.]|uniref:hypothetical protein n=1 Tax=Lacrimispora sp. TaxID=2719234 RepID=UPI0028989C60|nr:hypothetical protein [Lacrimispora sp.]